MPAYLQKFLRVLPEENGKVAQFALLAALLQGGVAIGMTATDSLFLATLGAQKLPLVYLGLPWLMLVYAPVYSVLLAKYGTDRVVRLTLTVLTAGGLCFGASGALAGAGAPWLLYAMKFYVGLWFVALYTLFWNFTDDYFSILDGKRLYGIIAAGGAAGATAGAASVSLLSPVIAPGYLFFAWAMVSALTIPLFGRLCRKNAKLERADDATETQSTGAVLRAAFDALRTSPFALALAAACFFAVTLTSVLEYLTMGVFAQAKTAAELARLLGELYATANLLALAVNLCGYNRLVTRLGVGPTALVLPLAYTAAFAGFFLQHGFVAALLAFYAYQTVLTSIEYNNVNLLYNALPNPTKRALRTFIEGVAEPLATAAAGALLLAWASTLGTGGTALAGLALGLFALGIAAFLRHDYGPALAENLRRDWLDFSPAEESWQTRLTDADRAMLRERARHGEDRAERLAAIDLLAFTRDPELGDAVARLVETAPNAPPESIRLAIDRALESDHTPTVAQLLLWIESPTAPDDPELLDAFTTHGALPVRPLPQWLQAHDPARVALTAVARWHGSDLAAADRALVDVQTLLTGDAQARRWGVRALGGFRQPQHARTLLDVLDRADGELRREALRALVQVATPEMEGILPRLLPLLPDAAPDERRAILAVAQKIGTVGAVADLLSAASEFPASDNRLVEELIAGFGPRAIATVTHVLRNPTASFRSRVLAARILRRLAQPQLDLLAADLIATELRRATEAIAAAATLAEDCASGPRDALLVLRRFYRDAAAEAVDFATHLLGLTGRLPDVELILASLASANPKDRANAIEAIEQSCSRDVFGQIRPLLRATGRRDTEPAVVPAQSVATLLRQAAASENVLECAAALVALGHCDPARGREFIHRRIDASEPPRVTAALGSLLSYFEPIDGQPKAELHLLQRVAVLIEADYFSGARISALQFLAAHSTERHADAGTTLYTEAQPSDALMVVADGIVRIENGTTTHLLGRGGTCNGRALMGTITRDEIATSRGSTLLLLPCAVVARAIEIHPALGISLYRTKIVAGSSP